MGTVFDTGIGLSCQGICVVRGGNTILEDVSIDLEPGSINVLQGSNGSGKTSFLRILSGNAKPTAGTVLLTGDEAGVANLSEATLMLGHLNGLKHSMTVKETITFWIQLYGSGSDVTQLSKDLELLPIYDQRVGTLSAGQKRRVAIARAVISERPIWLLDEPTTSLDRETKERIENQIEKHKSRNGLAVIATHDPITLSAARFLSLESTAQ